MNEKSKNILLLFVSLLIVVPLYIFLHEGGHALVAVLCGGRITDFSILQAHMSSVDGEYNTVTSSLLKAGGVLLPIIITSIYILLYRKENEKPFYRIFSCLFVLGASFSSAAWILVPILYLNGSAPVNDDATQFLNVSGINPIVVIVVAVLLLSALVIFTWRRKIFQNYLAVFRSESKS
ncbi:M50 family metallopeptidase [uncultured Robinsoniella sp.]|uniref:M50 family metallopeptidase n=1 Tax=uncultured Robinsoniella sp. TaxID=904190 RepID=UPI00374E3572